MSRTSVKADIEPAALPHQLVVKSFQHHAFAIVAIFSLGNAKSGTIFCDD